MAGRRKKRQARGAVLEEIERIAFADFTDFCEVVEEEGEDGAVRQRLKIVPTDSLPREKRAAVASLKQCAGGGIEIKLYDKWKALEVLLEATQRGDNAQEGTGGEAVRIIDDIG